MACRVADFPIATRARRLELVDVLEAERARVHTAYVMHMRGLARASLELEPTASVISVEYPLPKLTPSARTALLTPCHGSRGQ